jgi:pimeloyl-ACP methyl ester carboxylesterase
LDGYLNVIHGFPGREQATLVAHDRGSAAAWRLAMDYPQAVERLLAFLLPL